MNTNINLDFLYYQAMPVLGGIDPKEEKYDDIADVFYERMVSSQLSEAIQLIILGYKEKFAQYKFYATCFYDVNIPLEDSKYPEGLSKYDYFMPKTKMARNDIQHLILRIFKDDYKKTNARFLKEMELVFTSSQNLNNVIEDALEGKEVIITQVDDVVKYSVVDSAISEIEVSPLKFIMRINSDKWKAYY
jgi:hypothetical protein